VKNTFIQLVDHSIEYNQLDRLTYVLIVRQEEIGLWSQDFMMLLHLHLCLWSLLYLSEARPLVQSLASRLALQALLTSPNPELDVTATPAFLGLTTFANLPYVHCLGNGTRDGEYDIGILGAPFDTVRRNGLLAPELQEQGMWLLI
jgi:hypothetical protein